MRLKMKAMNKTTGLLFCLLSTIAGLKAQENKKEVFKEDYEVYTSYRPQITDAIKMDIVKVNEKMDLIYPDIKYEVLHRQFQPEKITVQLPAVRLVKNRQPYLDNFFLKAGAGNYFQFLTDFIYNTTYSRNFTFSTRAFFNNGRANVKKSNLMEEGLELKGRMFKSGKTMYSSLEARNFTSHYYGFDPQIRDFPEDSIRQNYFKPLITLGLHNHLSTRAKIKYNLSSQFYYLLDRFHDAEFSGKLKGTLQQDFLENPMKFGAEYMFYRINLNDYVWYRNMLNIHAGYSYSQEIWQLEGGFDITTENDSNRTRTHFYPFLNGNLSMFDNHLNLYAGLGGNLQVRSWNSLLETNLYLGQNFKLRNTNNKVVFHAGLKGNISGKFNYRFEFENKTVENYLLFVNDSADTKQFTTRYDTGLSSATTITLELGSVNLIENLDLSLAGHYYITQLSHESFTWHEPKFDLKLLAKYHLGEKIYFSAEYFLIGERPALSYSSTGSEVMVTLPAINDLNLGIRYHFTNKFAVFFDFKNILARKYSYWYMYELRGFHFLGGVTYSF